LSGLSQFCVLLLKPNVYPIKKSHSIWFIISGPSFIHACYDKGENPFETTATEYNKIVFSWLNTSHRMLHVLRSKNI